MFGIRISIVLVGIFFLPCIVSAQNQKHPESYGAWLMYFGDNKLNKKFGLHSEVQLRNVLLANNIEQYLLRPGINYYVSPNTLLSTGYAFVYTNPSSERIVGSQLLEHRIWEQLILRQRYRNVFIEHRYRLEQRFINNLDMHSNVYDNRIRYRLQTTFPLYSIHVSLRHIFLNAYNELFLNIGRKSSGELFDRNRLYFAIGYQVSPKLNFQLGYLNQSISINSARAYDVNHNLQIGMLYNLDLEFLKQPSKAD